MKLAEFIERKIVEQKGNMKFHYQKSERKWYTLLDFQVPGNYKDFTGYLNKCLHGKIISKLIDRPMEFDKVYCFAGKMKMKLWIKTSTICEPILAALNAALDGLDKISNDKEVFADAIFDTSLVIEERYMPMLDKYQELKRGDSK